MQTFAPLAPPHLLKEIRKNNVVRIEVRGTRYEVRGARILCYGVFCQQANLLPRTSIRTKLFFYDHLIILVAVKK